jgi:hypothetical protein
VLAREPLDERCRRVEPPHQRREVELARGDQHDLAIQREPRLGERAEPGDELREVARERPAVPAPQLDVVAVAEREAAEAVPLRLVPEAPARQLAHEPREHRLHRDRDRERHAGILPRASTRHARRRIRVAPRVRRAWGGRPSARRQPEDVA